MFTLWYCNVGWHIFSAAKQLGYLRYGHAIMDAVDSTTLEALEKAFEKLQNSDSKSLLKKYLTVEVFEKLKTKKTSYGSTLLDCIRSGIENLDSGVGVYAPDSHAYEVFADLFDPIIEDYHAGFKKDDHHPVSYFGDAKDFGTLDPEGKLIISTRIRVGRSIDGYPFNPCMEQNHYEEIEQKSRQVFSSLKDDLSGEFYPLTNMQKDVQQRLIDDHFLFKEGDRFLQNMNPQNNPYTSCGDDIDILLDPETLLMEEEVSNETSGQRNDEATLIPQPRWVDKNEEEEIKKAAERLPNPQPSPGHTVQPVPMDIQPRSHASMYATSEMTDSENECQQFIAILEDAEEYAQTLKQKLEGPNTRAHKINALSNKDVAIEATIKDLDYIPRGLAREILRRARQVKRKMLVLQSTIKTKVQQNQVQELAPVPVVREDADEQRHWEEQACWDARALELARELGDALCKEANARKAFTTSQKKVHDLSALVHEDLGVQPAEFILQYLPNTTKAAKRERSQQPAPLVPEQRTLVRGERGQPGIVTGRGIYHNSAKTFLVWVNEEDHLRVISMQQGGNVFEIFDRLIRGLKAIEKQLSFAHDSRLGFLTFCPTNLGTTIRASVLIKIPRLLAEKKILDEISKKHNLQVRGTRGEHSSAEGGIVDVSNKRRLGLTEYDAVKEMYCGICEIVKKEYQLANKK